MKAAQCKGYVTLGKSIYAIDHHNVIRAEIIPIESKCTNRDQTCFVSDLRSSKNDAEGTGDIDG